MATKYLKETSVYKKAFVLAICRRNEARVLFAFCLFPIAGFSQAQQPVHKRISIDETINTTRNNLQYGINTQQINKGKEQIKSAALLPKTGLFAENEDLSPADKNGVLKIGISQSIDWPGLYKAKKNLYFI